MDKMFERVESSAFSFSSSFFLQLLVSLSHRSFSLVLLRYHK
jgi:hypothetical protein